MSEEEIIKYIKDEIEVDTDTFHWFDNTPKNETRIQIEKSIKAHQGLLDLYNNEKEKNKVLKEDIKNMHDKEAVISIIEDEFDLSRNEVIEIIENY